MSLRRRIAELEKSRNLQVGGSNARAELRKMILEKAERLERPFPDEELSKLSLFELAVLGIRDAGTASRAVQERVREHAKRTDTVGELFRFAVLRIEGRRATT